MRKASLPALLAFVGATPASGTDPSQSEVYSAIWSDVELNAMIGNGNIPVSWDWALGHDADNPPKLAISKLVCHGGFTTQKCKFELTRIANERSTNPNDAREPTLLNCEARLERKTDGDGMPSGRSGSNAGRSSFPK